MAKLVPIKSLVNTPNAVETNSIFNGLDGIEIYRTDKNYVPGDKVLYLNTTTGKHEAFKCITATSGTWSSGKWTLLNSQREIAEAHYLQEKSRALELAKQIPSGFIDLSTTPTTGMSSGWLTPPGRVQFPATNQYLPHLNKFGLTPVYANVNGSILYLCNTNMSAGSNWLSIALSEPPANGTRTDFVFLEMWYEEVTKPDNTRKIKPNYRIRVVDDVDFVKYPDGLGDRMNTAYIGAGTITPQGPNTSPIALTGHNAKFSYYGELIRQNPGATFHYKDFNVQKNDYALFVSGVGDEESKERLKTYDGYIYALPMFKITRRNTAGYSVNNLNGSRNLVRYPFPQGFQYDFDSYPVSILKNSEIKWKSTDPLDPNIKVGDKIVVISSGDGRFQFTEINASRTGGKLKRLTDSFTATDGTIHLTPDHTIESVSGRPDGKFANVLYDGDIVDLRHKVSLNGFNYDKLLKESFDKYLRGELNPPKETVVEQLGMNPKANISKYGDFSPVFVKTSQGDKYLKNMFTFNSTLRDAHWILNDASGGVAINPSSPPNVFRMDKKISGGGTVYTSFGKLNGINYYLISADITLNKGKAMTLYVDGYGGGTGSDSEVNVVGTTARKFIRLGPEKVNRIDSYNINIHLMGNGVSGGFDGEIKNVAIYELTKDEYESSLSLNSDELSNIYPYVESQPKQVSNICPPLTSSDVKLWGASNGKIVYRTPNEIIVDKSVADSWLMIEKISVKQYSLYCLKVDFLTSGAAIAVLDKDGNVFKSVYSSRLFRTFHTGESTEIKIYISVPASLSVSQVNAKNIMISEVLSYSPKYVPRGIWEVSNINNLSETNDKFVVSQKRKTLSQSQHTDQIIDLIEPIATPQGHISVIQATKGTWSVNDTIKISSVDGIILGAMDSDTSLTRIVSFADNTLSYLQTADKKRVKVESVLGFSVNDTVKVVGGSSTNYMSSGPWNPTITAIDTVNKIITFSGDVSMTDISLWSIVNITPASSVPSVRLSKTDGTTSSDFTTITWTGLGTSEITGTISAVNVDSNKGTFSIKYNVAYPAGRGLSNLPDEIIDVKVNGQKYVKTTNKTIQSKANFIGKVSGSTITNPHIFKSAWNSVLSSIDGGEEYAGEYVNILTLDGSNSMALTVTNNWMAQHMFSFNLVEHVQRTYGTIPGATTADKVAWLRTNVYAIRGHWWGFGSSSTGNKASLSMWFHNINSWVPPENHTSGQVKGIIRTVIPGLYPGDANAIGPDGFVHVLAYAEPSDGVTASAINTDYVELQVELSTDIKTNLLSGDNSQTDDNYELFVPEKQEISYNENILSQALSYPVDTSLITTSIALLNPGVQLTIDSPGVVKGVTTGTAQGIALIADTPTIRKVPHSASFMFKANAGEEFQIHLNDSWLSGANGKDIEVTATGEWQKVTINNFTPQTKTLVLIIREMWEGTTFYAKDFMINEGVVVKDFVIGRKQRIVNNFMGKIAGSSLSIPHSYKHRGITELTPVPSLYTSEHSQTHYDNISKKNNGLLSASGNDSGSKQSILFEFDLNYLGMSIKEIKKALTGLNFYWTGYGHGYNAGVKSNDIILSRWNAVTSSWVDVGTYSQATLRDLTSAPTLASALDAITNEGKIYFRIVTVYPSENATNTSFIYTDYVSLDLQFAEYIDQVKQNVIKIRKSTKEMKLHFPKKSYINGQEDVVEITYTHSKVPNTLTTTEKVTILAELDNVFASDLSSSVGFKQGTHHYMNPLYRLGIDSTQVFGEIGFANIPLAADSKNINTGALIDVGAHGMSNGATKQYALPVIKKPMVFTMAYLVLHNSELKLLLISRLTTNGSVTIEQSSLNSVLLIPIEGRPLVKETAGVARSGANVGSTEWKTPTGEILGYLNDKGEVIVTYQ